MECIAAKIARVHVVVHSEIPDGPVRRAACQDLIELQEMFDLGVPEPARSCAGIQREVDRYNEEQRNGDTSGT
jgi:hypothetical protein